MTRVAEQAEMYAYMLEFIEPVIIDKGGKMSPDERMMFGVACKNVIA